MKHLYKLFLLTFFIFAGQHSIGQTYSSIITDKEIYDFLNWLTLTEKKYDEEPRIKQKKIFYKIISWDTTRFPFKDTIKSSYIDSLFRNFYIKGKGLDEIFMQANREFYFNQNVAIKDTIWHQRFDKSRLIKNKICPNRYYYSIPLFSLDKKIVIINKIYYCGSECAYGGYYIYKKVDNDKWEFITAQTWES